MASGFRFVPDEKGFAELRNSEGVQGACLGVAERIAAAAQHGKYHFATDVQPGQTRCHARTSWSPSEAMATMGRNEYYKALKDDPAKQALADALNGG